MRRDLTERTRGDHPEPLYSLADIRRMIQTAELKLHVEPDAERWLQDRASSAALGGEGGIGAVLAALHLAEKIAYLRGASSIGVEHLAAVQRMQTGEVEESAAEPADVRRAV